MIICRNYMILLIIQPQCYYISNLKHYKTLGSLSIVFQYSNLPSSYLRTRSHFRKDNHWLLSESQKAVISTPDIGYSFSINPQWTWKKSTYYWGGNYEENLNKEKKKKEIYKYFWNFKKKKKINTKISLYFIIFFL